MKFMVTGGNRGLGLAIVNYFDGVNYSRENGYDITKHVDALAEASLAYDVFVNNAFDGPFQESWANFAQVQLLFAVASKWQLHNKFGYIINIGSAGTELLTKPDPNFETYRISKSALKQHSRQWTRAFKENSVCFKTSLLTVDRLDTELSRSRSTWTGNGQSLDDICNYIKTILHTPGNTCIEEIISYVNFDFTN
jgi:hypothetical protein